MSPTRPQLPEVEPTYNPRRPFPHVHALYNNVIPNCPGKSIVAFKISMPPNGSTPPHTHAGAFVSANIVSGYVFNKMNDEPMEVFGPGESFTEHPGCRHRISDNASTTEPALFIATLVVDTKVVNGVGVEGLLIIDEEYREMVKEATHKAFEEDGTGN